MEALQTNEEIKEIEDEKTRLRADPKGEIKYGYTKDNYMKRQPRVDLTKYNYNYEQFKKFTQLYDAAKKKDTEELKYFYKMVKYARAKEG